jgi:hypothetical protein
VEGISRKAFKIGHVYEFGAGALVGHCCIDPEHPGLLRQCVHGTDYRAGDHRQGG